VAVATLGNGRARCAVRLGKRHGSGAEGVGGGGACVVALRRCIYLIDEVTCDAKANWKCAERACTATGVRGYAVRVKPYVSGSTAGVLAIIVQSRKVRYRRGGVLFTRFLYTYGFFVLISHRVVRSTAYTDFYNNTFFCVIICAL
jgi:hypothetical protein